MSATGAASTANERLFDLVGRRALVTGASRGIGRAIAAGLAARGASVMGVARSAEGLGDTSALVDGGGFRAHPADLRDPQALAGAVEAAVETMGGLDILVNNAGDDHDDRVERIGLDAWTRVLEVNLRSCFLLAQAASAHLREGEGGKVINVASVLGLVAVRNSSPYVAAKHGLVGLTRALALEWARRNVQVNALAPGFVETAMMAAELKDETVAAWIRSNTPAGRWAQPEEMVGPAVFLASHASDFMTGQVLVVDGGWTAQ